VGELLEYLEHLPHVVAIWVLPLRVRLEGLAKAFGVFEVFGLLMAEPAGATGAAD
jgi:hypothetical protein